MAVYASGDCPPHRMMRFAISGNADFHLVRASPPAPGRELDYLVPEGLEFQQLTYGQGEGEFLMSGYLLAVFWENPRRLIVEIDAEESDFEKAMELVRRIGQRVFDSPNIRIAPEEPEG